MSTRLRRYQQRFDDFAKQHLPTDADHIGRVYEALHYSFFATGGKRLRPALVYALADSLGIDLPHVDRLALAIECIHTYSLIHDDLPAMDDDDLRRGQPACHKKFDEATAILAGDALNTLAFELLSEPSDSMSPNNQLQQIKSLARGAGISGMVGGQDTDLACDNHQIKIDLQQLSQLHIAKTARLIEACFITTYLASNHVNSEKLNLLSEAALALGLFYQIQDDILDVTQTSDVLGKPSGSDVDNGKATYVGLLTLTGAQDAASQQRVLAEEKLTQFFLPNDYFASPLSEIIAIITQRSH